MPFRMQPAQFPHGGFPEGTERAPGSSQTYPVGTPVTWDTTSQELNEHPLGANVTNIVGVSLEAVVSGESTNPSGNVNFAKATRSNVFIAVVTNGSGEVQDVTPALVGNEYGLRKNGSGVSAWFSINSADTTNAVVQVTGIDTERNIAYFKFIESAIQEI